jgi:hypothetical protein
MIENDIKEHSHAVLVCCGDQIHQILPIAESRIDLKKILDRVAVVAVPVCALFPDWSNPERCRAERFKIIELRSDSFQSTALETAATGRDPVVPLKSGGSVGRRILGVKKRTEGLPSVAKPIRQKKIDNLIPPIDRRTKICRASWQLDITDGVWTRDR